MKKFFGLKMALAVLAAGVFVSCSDSEAGDIYIPTPSGGGSVEVKYPAPTYVVAGVVTDAEDGSALEGVAVSGAVTATTDATGFFTSGVKSEPINGVITFTKTGYVSVNRAVAMAAVTTGTVSESLVVAMSTGTPSLPEGITVVAVDPTAAPAPIAEEAVFATADKLAALGVPVVNETDKDMVVMVPADGFGLPYGAKLAAEKSDANALDAMILWGLITYGNDPTKGFGTFKGLIPVTIPAKCKVEGITTIPMLVFMYFIYEDGTDGITSRFAIEVIDSYYGVAVPVDDPHNPHNNGNGGGGENTGA